MSVLIVSLFGLAAVNVMMWIWITMEREKREESEARWREKRRGLEERLNGVVRENRMLKEQVKMDMNAVYGKYAHDDVKVMERFISELDKNKDSKMITNFKVGRI